MLSKKDIYREKQFDKCLKKYCQICQCLNLMTLGPLPLFCLVFSTITNTHDFEKAIDYLIQHQQEISLNDLIVHLPDYLNKINSN